MKAMLSFVWGVSAFCLSLLDEFLLSEPLIQSALVFLCVSAVVSTQMNERLGYWTLSSSVVFTTTIVTVVPLVTILSLPQKDIPIGFWIGWPGLVRFAFTVFSLGLLISAANRRHADRGNPSLVSYSDEASHALNPLQIIALAIVLLHVLNIAYAALAGPLELAFFAVFLGPSVIYYLISFMFCWVLAITLAVEIQTRREIVSMRALEEIYTTTKAQAMDQKAERDQLERRVKDRFRGSLYTRPVELVLSSLMMRRDAPTSEAIFGTISKTAWSETTAGHRRDFGNTLISVIPMLGFLGTVIGLARTVAGFHQGFSVSSSDIGQSVEQLASNILQSLSGLSFAFETTILGLGYTIFALILYGTVSQKQINLSGEIYAFCERLTWQNVK